MPAGAVVGGEVDLHPAALRPPYGAFCLPPRASLFRGEAESIFRAEGMEAHTIEKTLNVLEREFRSLGLGQDLIRLAKCCEVEVDGKVQYSSALRKSKSKESEAVEDLIFELIRWLDGQEAQADAETRYSQFMSEDGNDPDDPEVRRCRAPTHEIAVSHSASQAFERFFEEKLGGDECHLVQLLKGCTQAALAPCNIELKTLLTKSYVQSSMLLPHPVATQPLADGTMAE